MARIVRPKFRTRQHRFNPRQQRSRPPRAWWRRLDSSPILLAVLVFTASFVWLLPALHERGGTFKALFDDVVDVSVAAPWSSGIQVVDGDTVRSGGEIYRLVGFNTPESGFHARCGRERALASEATARLRELVDDSDVELSLAACACAPGTEGTDACNYGRLCGRLKADGRDVGQILIAEGLAETYTCWGTSCPRRKDWCAG
jgi:nuclease-like protein